MEQENAWEAMFSLVPPTGVDLDKAEAALMGKGEVDPSIKLKPKIQQRTDEFLMDPAGFLSANASDPRVSRWTRLVSGLGGYVAGTSLDEAAPPPKRTLSASALMSASVGDGTPTAPVFGSGKAGGLSPDGVRPKRARDKDNRNSKDRGDGAQAGDKQSSAGKTSQPADKAQFAPAPDLVHGFQSVQDRGRVVGELVRERRVATRRETPGAQKKRLDAEAAERQRRLDEDARERQRRQAEEEEALRRRLAIEAEADEKKRLADLRLAAEKQRLDEEAEERREERRRAREEPRERKPPEPPPDRNLPPIGMMVIQSPKYIDLRDRLMSAVQRERHGQTGAQDEVREISKEITRLACSRNRLEELAGGMLQRLRRSLAAWEDVHDPKTFQVNYVTGRYDDAG